jgi:crotonobetainyl-CoA:carnitine CoA-transferase CaiB-like acyl-CoA transferase
VSHPPALLDPVTAWAASGGMWLTGWPDGEPRADRAGVLAVARELAAPFPGADVGAVLFGRAAWAGFTRRGRISAGGSCRLLRAADGWVAVTLARPDDVAAVAALVQSDVDEPWAAVQAFAANRGAADVADRAQIRGIPAAELGAVAAAPAVRTTVVDAPTRRPRDRPLVVDLSALWAGPLCAHLLGRTGARVVKVESPDRPDGARRGDRRFYDWLHGGHESVVLDLRSPEFGTLLRRADVVIEGSRPRALRQLGIVAEEVVAASGSTWVSITGYGRDDGEPGRVAFGDDAAVAGGLVAWDEFDEPVFCADAIADPLTGLHAAAGALAALTAGGGRLLDVAMARVAATVAAEAGLATGGPDAPVLPPYPPAVTAPAPEAGADTAAVLAELT